MIIDPIRDLSSYIRVVDEEGLTITHAKNTYTCRFCFRN